MHIPVKSRLNVVRGRHFGHHLLEFWEVGFPLDFDTICAQKGCWTFIRYIINFFIQINIYIPMCQILGR